MNYGRLFVGVILLSLGLLWGLDAAGALDAGEIIADWWPLALVLAAALMFVANPGRWLLPLIVLVVAVVLLLTTSGIVEANIWQFVWPAILIVIGLSFLFGRSLGSQQTSSEDTISQFVLFSGSEIANHSDRFSGGSVSAVFGGTDVDLRNAGLADGAELEVFTAFGGVEIRVPEGWNVDIRGFPIFGGFENVTSKERLPAGAPKLVVQATCLFGGIEVKH